MNPSDAELWAHYEHQALLSEFHNRGARFVGKGSSSVMKWIGRVNADFLTDSWTTVRWPGEHEIIVYYPTKVIDPRDQRHGPSLRHELHHVRDYRRLPLLWMALLYFLLPLPFVFSGRWFLEREALAHDLVGGYRSLDQTVGVLWSKTYVWAWPKGLARAWLSRRVRELSPTMHHP